MSQELGDFEGNARGSEAHAADRKSSPSVQTFRTDEIPRLAVPHSVEYADHDSRRHGRDVVMSIQESRIYFRSRTRHNLRRHKIHQSSRRRRPNRHVTSDSSKKPADLQKRAALGADEWASLAETK
nr:hypothetical protein CFP56_70419 [Quercus suber]